MKKTELNKQLIESLNESSNVAFLERVNDVVYNLVSQALSDISEKSAFVRLEKCVLLPVNEIYTGAVGQLSTFDYFLGIENPQIELNTKSRKNFWKYAWREFKASWRLGRKKYKKSKKIKEESVSTDKIEKYQLSDFRHDVLSAMAEYLGETTVLYEHMRNISIIGREDFGTNVKINIFVGVYDSAKDSYKLYSESKNKYFELQFGNRYANLDLKKEMCGENFVDMLKIFNAIYSKTYNRIPNQVLLESLLWRCPNLLFKQGETFQTFVNVANFIRLADPKDFKSICDESKTIFQEKLILGAGKQVEFGKIINMLDNFKY